jgi:para-nitrobenzyl esterase
MRHIKFLPVFVTILFALSSCNQNKLSTIIQVRSGKIEGVVENGITIFKGIPFAAPPVGNLRWKAPQPEKSWEGVLRTDKFAPACPQIPLPIPGVPKLEMSEDCLYLNVWTPAKSADEKLPVMVWIYGGGFALGSTSFSIYSGENLARKGVVLVSIAYRVGPLGFLAHPELSAESPKNISGNYGLLDQIAGLKWVRENISSFGGNPDNVTIFGESAGGTSVSMLCASPLAEGLFSGAISQSGGNFGPVYTKDGSKHDGISNLSALEKLGVEFAEKMAAGSIAGLREVDPEKWINEPLSQMGGWWPVVDGYVIVGDQYKLYETGNYNDVNVIVGTNSDEGFSFAHPIGPGEYKKDIKQRFGDFSDMILEAYPGDTKEQAYTSSADIFRETDFAWPSWAWARLQTETGKSKVFMYYFDQQQTLPGFSMTPRGAQHGADVVYVFQHLDQDVYSAEDSKLSEMITDYWTNFAKYGDPNGKGLLVWPEFKAEKSKVMYLNSSPKVGPVPNLDKLELMEKYFKYRRETN